MAKTTNHSKEIKDLEEAINSPATPEPQKAKMREIVARLKADQSKAPASKPAPKKEKAKAKKPLAKTTGSETILVTVGSESELVNVSGKATNFDIRISKKEAERLVKSGKFNDDKFGVIMCKEYGQDEDWVGMTDEDLDEETGKFDSDYKTFEIELGNDAKKTKATELEKTPTGFEKKGEAPYDCEDLIEKEKAKAKKRKELAEKRKDEPKKTEATKNVEKIEKVESNLEKRLAKNEVSKSEIQKLIDETEALLNKLKTALKNAK